MLTHDSSVWSRSMSRYILRSASALTGFVALIALGMVSPAFSEADRSSGLDRTTANTLSGNYLAALVAGLSSDTSAAAQFYAESLKFDPHSADLAERAFVTMLAEGNMAEAVRMAQTVNRKNP
ncbi:MAG: hypothetical protein EBU34_13420, partial [Alphaproteobacteria bacterium]|nr:hypothetical protein [Alphaproteobacteria bacterium]